MYRSLEKIYSQQVRGNVAPRRHLRVLGEEKTEQEVQEVAYNKDMIKDLLDTEELDDKQLKKLYHLISTFKGYRPVKSSLQKKGFNELILKKFSRDVLMLIEDEPTEDKADFFNILENEKTPDFPNDSDGNVFALLGGLGLSDNLVRQIISHTGQDAAKRGVGMGEVALALLFANISSAGASKLGQKEAAAAKYDAAREAAMNGLGLTIKPGPKTLDKMRAGEYGDEGKKFAEDIERAQQEQKAIGPAKGDLELNGREFEIKGSPASLGPTPDVIYKSTGKYVNQGLVEMDISSTGGRNPVYTYREDGKAFDKMTQAIAHAYRETADEDKGTFEDTFRTFIQKGGAYNEASMNSSIFKNIDLSVPQSIQKGIAILNLFRYAKEEGFEYFMAHDMGAEKGGVGGVGKYIFVGNEGASPEFIASEVGKLVDAGTVKFERLRPNNLRPRIGFAAAMTSSDEEALAI
tara:strand:- start:13 stop:1401 length:1389 start_codon:yes stop_codon:yes gene_type:complete